jgi:hypothetical protein
MKQSSDPFGLLATVMIGATIADIITHADGFTAYMLEVWDDRCSHCGYRYNHPIVVHQAGYKGKECGWR